MEENKCERWGDSVDWIAENDELKMKLKKTEDKLKSGQKQAMESIRLKDRECQQERINMQRLERDMAYVLRKGHEMEQQLMYLTRKVQQLEEEKRAERKKADERRKEEKMEQEIRKRVRIEYAEREELERQRCKQAKTQN